MRSLNKPTLLAICLLFSINVFCQTNPFNATFSLNHGDTSEAKSLLVVGIVSERNEGKYKLMIDTYGDSIKLTNGNEVFTGKADSAVRQEHYLPLELIKEGSGEITARIYTFTDSMDIDSSSRREFFVNYTVKKKQGSLGLEVDLSDVKERKGQQANETGQITLGDMQQLSGTASNSNMQAQDQNATTFLQDNVQKFIINTDKRYNNMFREILFILSFIVLVYLCYRILAKK